jgi:hypothetical protein
MPLMSNKHSGSLESPPIRRSDLSLARPAMLICLAFNLLVFFYLSAERPEYFSHYRLNPNPDATDYVRLGQNVITAGHFSRCNSPPFVPDLLRTPVYPIFAGGLHLVGGPRAIYFVQSLLAMLSCWLVVKLTRPIFGDRAAFWASLLFAGDLTLAIANFEAMSEPLYLLLNLGGTVCLLPVLTGALAGHLRWARLLGGGGLLGIATLTRPVGLYLVVVFAGLLIARALWYRATMRGMIQSTLLLTAFGMPVGAWIARNSIVFSVPHLTNADAIMLVYFSGAGAYEIEHGLTLEQAQRRVESEYALPSPRLTNNHWLSAQPVGEMDSQLRAAQKKILLKYPRSLAISSLMGVLKAATSHNVGVLAAAAGREWHAPRISALLQGKPVALKRLSENGTPLVAAFVWQALYLVASVALAAFGVFFALCKRCTRWPALVLLTVVGYFQLTVAVVGIEAYYRCRIPHMPFLYAFAGLALAEIPQLRARFFRVARSTPHAI